MGERHGYEQQYLAHYLGNSGDPLRDRHYEEARGLAADERDRALIATSLRATYDQGLRAGFAKDAELSRLRAELATCKARAQTAEGALEQLGLRAFMRGKTPPEIADHYERVVRSHIAAADAAESERDELRRRLEEIGGIASDYADGAPDANPEAKAMTVIEAVSTGERL